MTSIADDITVFSPHMLKLFQSCPAKFYYRYIEQIPSPVHDKGFQTGRNIHALASYYLKGINIAKFEEVLSAKETEMWKRLKSKKYFDYEIIGIEKSIISRIKNYWIGGRLDALVKKDKDYYILDYKTGGVDIDMRYDLQTMVYLTTCDRFIENYDSLSFVYIDLKEDKEVTVLYNSDLKEEYTQKLTDLCMSIEKFDISKYNKPDFCKCEYEKLCITQGFNN